MNMKVKPRHDVVKASKVTVTHVIRTSARVSAHTHSYEHATRCFMWLWVWRYSLIPPGVSRCVCTSTSQGFLRQDFLTGPKPIRFVSVRPPAKQLECRIMEKQQDCSPTPQNPSRQRAVGVVMRFSGAASLVVDADVYHMHLCGT